jgi:hypothetical protein
LRSLEGQALAARGWLVPMKGDWWLMRIGHPSMLESMLESGAVER